MAYYCWACGEEAVSSRHPSCGVAWYCARCDEFVNVSNEPKPLKDILTEGIVHPDCDNEAIYGLSADYIINNLGGHYSNKARLQYLIKERDSMRVNRLLGTEIE